METKEGLNQGSDWTQEFLGRSLSEFREYMLKQAPGDYNVTLKIKDLSPALFDFIKTLHEEDQHKLHFAVEATPAEYKELETEFPEMHTRLMNSEIETFR